MENSQNTKSIIILGLSFLISCSYSSDLYNYLCDYDDLFTDVDGTWTGNVGSTCTLQQTAVAQDTYVTWLGVEDPSLVWENIVVESTFSIGTASPEAAGIIIRAQTVVPSDNSNEYYIFEVNSKYDYFLFGSQDGNGYNWLHQENVNGGTISEFIGGFNANQDYTLRVEAIGSTFNVFIDDVFIVTVEDDTFPIGSVGLFTWGGGAVFKSLNLCVNSVITSDPTSDPTADPTSDPTSNPTSATSAPTARSTAPTMDPTESSESSDDDGSDDNDLLYAYAARNDGIKTPVGAEHYSIGNDNKQVETMNISLSDNVIWNLCLLVALILIVTGCVCYFYHKGNTVNEERLT